jgi:trk system potassium uptake protein TrkA
VEASILTTSVLVDLEVPDIWAKAITVAHGRILERVGAHHVIFPEHDMGRRVAHLVTGRMIEFVQLDQGFALVELKPPRQIVGRSLGEAQVRSRYGITVVCIKPAGGSFTYATQHTVPGPDDVLVVAGETDRVKGFAKL